MNEMTINNTEIKNYKINTTSLTNVFKADFALSATYVTESNEKWPLLDSSPGFSQGQRKREYFELLNFSPTDNWPYPEHDGEPLSRPSSCTDQSELEHLSFQQPHWRLAVSVAGCSFKFSSIGQYFYMPFMAGWV